MRLFIFLLLFPPLASAYNELTIPSAKRYVNESFQEARNRNETLLHKSSIKTMAQDSAIKMRVSLDKIDYSIVPDVVTYSELMDVFYLIRDSRFLYGMKKPINRRISWLYPDDGCFLRAALGGMKAEKEHLIRPAKIFVFGKLTAKSKYTLSGYVNWWYHVALILGYGGEHYVLDPSINLYGPILVKDWFRAVNERGQDLHGIVCNTYTVSVDDRCILSPKEVEQKLAVRFVQMFLNKEYERVVDLGMVPEAVLGDSPPWSVAKVY